MNHSTWSESKENVDALNRLVRERRPNIDKAMKKLTGRLSQRRAPRGTRAASPS
jgi:hypothetical protein